MESLNPDKRKHRVVGYLNDHEFQIFQNIRRAQDRVPTMSATVAAIIASVNRKADVIPTTDLTTEI